MRTVNLVALLPALPVFLVGFGQSVVAAPAVAIANAPSTSQADRLATFRREIAQELLIFAARANGPKPIVLTHDLCDAAFGILALGQPASGATPYLRKAFVGQDMDPKSPSYGQLPWSVDKSGVYDDNAAVLSLQAVGPVFVGYGPDLDPGLKGELTPHVEAALAALEARKKLLPSYTNIWLSRAESLVLCGEAFGDPEAATEGYAALDQWIDHTRKAGVNEYDSPTYYTIDLNAAGLGYRYAEHKDRFATILNYLWTDIASNYFPAGKNLSGPHSRDSDVLDQSSDLANYLYPLGLASDAHVLPFGPQTALALSSLGPGAYELSSTQRGLMSAREKVVKQIFDDAPAHDRYNYVTPGFAIGGATSEYGPDDQSVVIELAAGTPIPAVSLMADTTDRPYGERTDRTKSQRLYLHPVCVQSKGALLVLTSLSVPKGGSSLLDTDLLLPANASLSFNNSRAQAGSEFAFSGPENSISVVRFEDSVVVIRVFHADGVESGSGHIVMKAETVGLTHGLARLAIYHYTVRPVHRAKQGYRTGMLILAAHCESDAAAAALVGRVRQAAIDDSTSGDVWNVSAGLSGQQLAASVDLTHRTPPVRRIDGKDASISQPLTVNGIDYSQSILGPSPK